MTATQQAFDVQAVRRDFPALAQEVHGRPLVYLDSAATAQKPRAVVEAEERYYLRDCANVHRGVHALAERATRAYEEARGKVARLLNAEPRECVFVRGTTEAINLVAQSFARPRLREGDEVLVTHLEHHANIVPWQLVCEQTGATLKVVPIDDRGELVWEALEALLGPRTKVLSVSHASNALGTINPIAKIVELARSRGVPVVVDGAQGVPHGPVDVKALGCDFYAFSGHKAFGPTGIGVLWGKAAHLEAMPPYQGGGDMIRQVTFAKSTWAPIPVKFEAGTPNIAGVIGLGAAADYLLALDREAAAAWEQELLARATAALEELPGLRIVGQARDKVSVVSFTLEGAHPHDIATILDHEGVAVRAGHHCAQPLMERFGVPATARASFAFYNTLEEVDALVAALRKVQELFG
ncbi:MAG: cysteine desulfurase [Planctomycetes bacterium]|nr:cysteine desulfurase [Planctomycetota bacterium]